MFKGYIKLITKYLNLNHFQKKKEKEKRVKKKKKKEKDPLRKTKSLLRLTAYWL